MKFLTFITILIVFLASACIMESSDALTKKAIENKDISFCEKIGDQGLQNKCYFEISEFMPEACDKIVPFYCRGSPCFHDDRLIGQCYMNLYEKTKDENYCIKMESLGGDYDSIKYCFLGLGYSGDSLCKKFVSSYDDFWNCYMNDLKIEPNVTEDICINFSQISERSKTSCYHDLAKITKNEEYCSFCTYAMDEYFCITDVAIKKNDSKICDSLPSNCHRCSYGYSCNVPIRNESECKTFPEFCIEAVKNGGY